MALEDILISIDAKLGQLLLIAGASAGNAAVNAPVSRDVVFGDPEGTTYYHMTQSKPKAVIKVAPGAEAPVGGLLIGGVEAATLLEKYAKNGATGPKAGAGVKDQPAATTTSTPNASASSSSTSGDGTSDLFKALTDKITLLSKAEGGREKVVGLFKKWGVAKFPEVQKKGDFETKLADVAAAAAPPADDDLGLG